jgi:hypothetical protein
MSNFTVADLVGSICGVLLFLPLMTAPGYTAAWFSNALGFRSLAFSWRVLISIPLSLALSPILTYWLGSLMGWTGVWGFYACASLLCALLLAGFFGHRRLSACFSELGSVPRTAYALAAIWLAVSVISLVDVQIGHRLYFSGSVYDHSVRTAITDAITRTGVRPFNPFYDLGSLAPLRYHYFWFIACSLIDRLGGDIVNARQAIIASDVWSGWAFIATVPLFLRFVCNLERCNLRRTSFVALALTLVTGLDILPTIYYWHRDEAFIDMEWWNNNQVTSWWDCALWVPHHLAGLTSGIIVLLLLWNAASQTNWKVHTSQSILAGVALATMVGTSIYVALAIAVFLVLWTISTIVLREWRHALALTIAAPCVLLLAVPYLLTLTHSGNGGSDSTATFVVPSLRHFGPLDEWMARHLVTEATSRLLRLVFLPINYLLELGLFLFSGIVYIYRRVRNRSWDLSLTFTALLALTSIVICSTFRSAVIGNNDLGFRGFLPAQFILLLWTAELFTLAQPARLGGYVHVWRSPIWGSLILLGTVGTLYQVSFLRLEGPLADLGIAPLNLSVDRQLGRRTYALRQAYASLHRILPAGAIVQNNPEWNYDDYYYGLYSDRQTAVYDPGCGTAFGGNIAECRAIYPRVASIFSKQAAANLEQVRALFDQLRVSAVLVKDIDGAWENRQDWVWHTSPAFANEYVRVYLLNAQYRGEVASETTQRCARPEGRPRLVERKSLWSIALLLARKGAS